MRFENLQLKELLLLSKTDSKSYQWWAGRAKSCQTWQPIRTKPDITQVFRPYRGWDLQLGWFIILIGWGLKGPNLKIKCQ